MYIFCFVYYYGILCVLSPSNGDSGFKTEFVSEEACMIMMPMVIMAIESDADRNLMAAIYQKHRALMYKTARQYLSQESDVDDVVSDSCVALIQHIDVLRALDEKALRSYITETTRRKAIDLYRKRKNEQAKSIITDPDILDNYEERVSFARKISLQNEIDIRTGA